MALQIRMLLIDDDEDLCASVKRVLQSWGYDVDLLHDPTRAVDRIRKSEFHIVLVDLQMPQMNGIELIHDIRKVDRDIAIAVFTGYPSVDSAVEALRLNVSDYIEKPFEFDELREKLNAILKRKGLYLNPEEELHLTIGRNVRRVRKEQRLTLKHLSRRTGLSVSLLSQIERAESSASVSSLYKIASAFGVKLTEIFGDY